MKCRICKSKNKIKAGFICRVQRYRYKDCGYYYTVKIQTNEKPRHLRKLALRMYLEGMGFRAIGS